MIQDMMIMMQSFTKLEEKNGPSGKQQQTKEVVMTTDQYNAKTLHDEEQEWHQRLILKLHDGANYSQGHSQVEVWAIKGRRGGWNRKNDKRNLGLWMSTLINNWWSWEQRQAIPQKPGATYWWEKEKAYAELDFSIQVVLLLLVGWQKTINYES
jgi:hypothetical protein